MEPSKEAIQAAFDGLNHTGDPIGQALRSAYSIDFATLQQQLAEANALLNEVPVSMQGMDELHSDLLILLADLKQFLETREPGTTLGVTLHASLKKVLREKVQRMSERIVKLENL